MNKPTIKTILIIGTVLLMAIIIIFPIPAVLLDILILANLLFAFIIFLAVFINKKAVLFSLFPTIALLFSVICLSTFISAVRLILTRGTDFDGMVIGVVSFFITGFDKTEELTGIIIGLICIAVLITIKLLIAIRGATRILEVSARFVLDGHAQKMLKIEADFSSGAIDQKEAELRKEALQQEMDFYGSMDGAGKFISGAFKFGIFVLVMGIAGGIIIDYLIHDRTFNEALKFYPILLFCAYFVCFSPLCLIFIAAVNKVISCSGLKEFIKNSKRSNSEKETLETVSTFDPITLEIGYGLIPLVEKEKGAELIESIQIIRRQIAKDMGITIPKVRIIDNSILDTSEYRIMIKGREVERKNVNTDDPPFVIIKHLEEIIKKHAEEFRE